MNDHAFSSPNVSASAIRSPALAGERARERIAERRVLPLGLAGAIHRHPARGVGDVADQRLVHRAELYAAGGASSGVSMRA